MVLSMSVSNLERNLMESSAIAVVLTLSEDAMQALEVATSVSVLSIAFLGILYGELNLLYKR